MKGKMSANRDIKKAKRVVCISSEQMSWLKTRARRRRRRKEKEAVKRGLYDVLVAGLDGWEIA